MKTSLRLTRKKIIPIIIANWIMGAALVIPYVFTYVRVSFSPVDIDIIIEK